jgi:hypothetical protein
MKGDLDCCHRHVLAAFRAEAAKRPQASDCCWIDNERLAITIAANAWATAHGYEPITVDDVERAEPAAIGHSDYAHKLALYVAEKVVYP